jgi:hypothetical protein
VPVAVLPTAKSLSAFSLKPQSDRLLGQAVRLTRCSRRYHRRRSEKCKLPIYEDEDLFGFGCGAIFGRSMMKEVLVVAA